MYTSVAPMQRPSLVRAKRHHSPLWCLETLYHDFIKFPSLPKHLLPPRTPAFIPPRTPALIPSYPSSNTVVPRL